MGREHKRIISFLPSQRLVPHECAGGPCKVQLLIIPMRAVELWSPSVHRRTSLSSNLLLHLPPCPSLHLFPSKAISDQHPLNVPSCPRRASHLSMHGTKTPARAGAAVSLDDVHPPAHCTRAPFGHECLWMVQTDRLAQAHGFNSLDAATHLDGSSDQFQPWLETLRARRQGRVDQGHLETYLFTSNIIRGFFHRRSI